MKRLFIIAGANGSGKSTIAKVLLPTEGIVYVNPDDIARELNPGDLLAVRIAAGREALKRIDTLMDRGESFAIESTLSGNAYVATLERARSLGYETTIVYTFVDSAEACIARIAARVKSGGHPVPDEDVRRRYLRSKRNFMNAYAPLADHWMIFYNGENAPVLVAQQNRGSEIDVLTPKLYNSFAEGICPNGRLE